MGQVITTIVSIMLLLLVPLGIVQIHTALQTENELLELSLAATKYISNHGGRNDGEIKAKVSAFIQQELVQKRSRLQANDVSLVVTRIKMNDPVLWSHEDEFQLNLEIPYPSITTLFAQWQRPLHVMRIGTINTMDYDL
ncbi:hypothetical protein ACTID9_01235 [Brevibacillus fluminis]|uniref:hypothetical protein n=1 Tax=Brevibacillus fluminis TaxID=511487 RepID=UPI003F890EA8